MTSEIRTKVENLFNGEVEELRSRLFSRLAKADERIAEIVEYLAPICQEEFLAKGSDTLDVSNVSFPTMGWDRIKDHSEWSVVDYPRMRVGELLGRPTFMHANLTILCKDEKVRLALAESDSRGERCPSTW